eukprot:Amastigsp_a3583_40.p6 type:complete len:110 gc:universal Amastigsp_a3583_40:625-954(+)
MNGVQVKVALVERPVGPLIRALALVLPAHPLAFVESARGVPVCSLAVHAVLLPLPHVARVAVDELPVTMALEHAAKVRVAALVRRATALKAKETLRGLALFNCSALFSP